MDTYKPRVLSDDALAKKSKANSSSTQTPLKRKNDRQDSQLRPIFMKTNVVSQAAGSAYIEIDETKVICSIYGPRQSRGSSDFNEKGRLWCDFKFAPFALEQRRKRGLDDGEREHSLALINALSVAVQLDKFPKSVIEAYVVVLQDDGGVLPAAITCASLALADAGIDMYDMVASCSAGHVGDRVLVDPSKAEQQLYASQGVFGGVHMSYMASLRQVTHHSHTGSLPVEELEKLINLCMTGCEAVYSLMKKCLLDAAKKRHGIEDGDSDEGDRMVVSEE